MSFAYFPKNLFPYLKGSFTFEIFNASFAHIQTKTGPPNSLHPNFDQLDRVCQIFKSVKSTLRSVVLCQPGGVNTDPTVWLDGARLPLTPRLHEQPKSV